MSREIKFRAWDGDRMTNCGIQFNNTTGAIENKGNIALMQFTGLHDINGVEIYESDLVVVPGIGVAEVRLCPHYGVVYKTKGDRGFYEVPYTDCAAENDYPTVIGNIHQNPELLEQN